LRELYLTASTRELWGGVRFGSLYFFGRGLHGRLCVGLRLAALGVLVRSLCDVSVALDASERRSMRRLRRATRKAI
jgi:hypothetical protein